MNSYYEKLSVAANHAEAALPFSRTARFARADLEAYKDNAAAYFERVLALAEEALNCDDPQERARLGQELLDIRRDVMV